MLPAPPSSAVLLAGNTDLRALLAARPSLPAPAVALVATDLRAWRDHAVVDGVAELLTVGRETDDGGVVATSTEFLAAWHAWLAGLAARPEVLPRFVFCGAGAWDPVAGAVLLFADSVASPEGTGPARFTGVVPLDLLRRTLDAALPGRPVKAVLDAAFTGGGRTVTPDARVEDAPRLRDLDRVAPARVADAVTEDERGGRVTPRAAAPAAFAQVDPDITGFRPFDLKDVAGNLIGYLVVTGPAYVGFWGADRDAWRWIGAAWPDHFKAVPRTTAPPTDGTWELFTGAPFPAGSNNSLPNPIPDGKMWKLSRVTGGSTIAMDAHCWGRLGPARLVWFAHDGALTNNYLTLPAGSELHFHVTTNPTSPFPNAQRRLTQPRL